MRSKLKLSCKEEVKFDSRFQKRVLFRKFPLDPCIEAQVTKLVLFSPVDDQDSRGDWTMMVGLVVGLAG